MMAMIDEKSVFETQNVASLCNTLNNQVSNFYTPTLLLNTRIDFKSENEFENDSDDDFPTSLEKLKKKYNVLTADKEKSHNSSYSNGYTLTVKIKPPQKNIILANNNNFDGNELGEPKRVLYPREKICLEWKKIMRIGSGLMNLGNTCFMNSVLQCLTYCPPLVNYLISIKDDHPSKCPLSFCMICLMQKHISLVFNPGNPVVKPIYISQRLKSIAKHFVYGRQEDAHEFLRYVVDHMWRACLAFHELEYGIPGLAEKTDHLTKATTAINHIFGGYHRSQVLCMQCKAKSNTYDYFMDFMLDIQNVSSLEEALRNFVNPEMLRNENAYKCCKCKKSVTAKKQFTVYQAPNVATFQFKRFDGSKMFGKIVKSVSYPEILNLRPYMSQNGSPLMYKLISVLVHQGNTCNSGHYYCYVRNSNNSWYIMNDSMVSQVSPDEALNQKAYVLFYIRQPNQIESAKPILPSPKVNIQMPKVSSNNSKSDNISQNKVFNSNFKFVPDTNPLSPTSHKTSYDNNVTNKDTKTETAGSSRHLSNESIPKNVLVPYDRGDSDSDAKSDRKERKTDPNKNFKNQKSESENSSKNNDMVKEKVPILKVKATTNSWQVVENKPSIITGSRSIENFNSKWKIIRTPDSSENISIDQQSENENHINQNGEMVFKEKTKKKKKKSKKRKHMHCSDESDLELDWVERTKETLEMENLNGTSSKSNKNDTNVSNKKAKLSDSSSKSIIDALLKNASNGYGEVKSWNGNVSNLHKALTEDRHKFSSYSDRYNEEYDQGKTIKLKNKTDTFDLIRKNHVNPFQTLQQLKYSKTSERDNDNRNHHHRKYRGDNYHSNSSQKIKFKFKVNDSSSFKKHSKSNDHPHDRNKSNNRNSIPNNHFKFR